MRRLMTVAIVLLIVGLVSVVLFGPSILNGDVSEAAAQDQAVTVQRLTLNSTVGSTGTVAAAQVIDLSFDASGVVDEILVAEGNTVTAGQVLARLDTSDLEYQVWLAELALQNAQDDLADLTAPPTEEEILDAESSVLSAQSQLQSANSAALNSPLQLAQSCDSVATTEAALADAQDAFDAYVREGYTSDATFIPDPESETGIALDDAQSAYDSAVSQCTIATNDASSDMSVQTAENNLQKAELALESLLAGASESDIANAEAQVTQAGVELRQAQDDLDGAVLTAPVDGTITSVDAIIGASAASGAAMMSMIDTSSMHIDVLVDEQDVLDIAAGQPVDVTLDAFDNVVIPGTVTYVSPVGDDSQGIVTYTVRVELQLDEAVTQASAPAGPGGFAGPGGQGGFGGNANLTLILEKIGGFAALQGVIGADDAAEQLAALLEAADLTEDEQAALDELGGVDGLVTMLAQRSFGGAQGAEATVPGGFQPAAGITDAEATPDAAPPAETTVSTAAETTQTEPLPIRVGMTAEVEILIETLDNVLVVASTAIRYEGLQAYVLVDDGSEDGQRVDVEISTTVGGFAVITGDLSEGQTVFVDQLETQSGAATGAGGFGGGFVGGPGGGLPFGGG